ncbi:unnamed protein product [Owenia fusiformis]|nr:unnamed protein product [Owenia fusiformis]
MSPGLANQSRVNGSNQTTDPIFIEKEIENIIWDFVPPFIISIGTLGNVLSLIVLLGKKLRKTTWSLYLIVLAVCDTIVLFTGLFRQWFWRITPSSIDVRALSNTGCKIHTFLTYTCTQYSSWILVALTFERFVTVYFPLRSKTLCTRKTSISSLAVFLGLIISLNLHFYWTVNIGKYGCDVYDHSLFRFMGLIWPWIDLCVTSFLPFIIMLVCNTTIIICLVKERNKRLHLTKLSEQTTNNLRKTTGATIMFITVTFTFLVLTCPLAIYLTFWKYWSKGATPHTKAVLDLAWAIINMLQYTNNGINFYLYCLSGPRFRGELKQLCFARKRNLHDGRKVDNSKSTRSGNRSPTSVTRTTVIRST